MTARQIEDNIGRRISRISRTGISAIIVAVYDGFAETNGDDDDEWWMMGKMTGTQDGVGQIIEKLLLRLAAKSIAPRYTKMLHKERRSILCLDVT
jgi:hypothetical protein